MHHTITDGVGGVKLQLELLDLEHHPVEEHPMPEAPTPHVAGEIVGIDALTFEARRQAGAVLDTTRQVGSGLSDAVRDPVGAVLGLAGTATWVEPVAAANNAPSSPLMGKRSLSVHFDTITLPLGELKAAATVSGGKLNDAFVAGVIGGFQAYHGKAAPRSSGCGWPCRSTCAPETFNKAGNQFSPSRSKLPPISDPIARMTTVRELVESLRHKQALALTEPLAGILGRLPDVDHHQRVRRHAARHRLHHQQHARARRSPSTWRARWCRRECAFGPMAGAASARCSATRTRSTSGSTSTQPPSTTRRC